jgi:hypothetical protein
MSRLRAFLSSHGVEVKTVGNSTFAQGVDVASMAGTLVDAVLAPGAVSNGSAAGAVGFGAGLMAVAATEIGVWLSLGSGYQAARQGHKNESYASGFAQGFVAGLLGWSGKQTADHLAPNKVINKNKFDGRMNVIEVEAVNKGLLDGYSLAGGIQSPSDKQAFRLEIKAVANAQMPRHWNGDENRNARANYVIELAAALRRYFVK